MFPLSTPIIIYQSIMVLSAAWADFFVPMLIFEKISVLPLKIYKLQGDASIQKNRFLMGLIFASIPSFVIFAFFQKHIIGGINVGAVKG